MLKKIKNWLNDDNYIVQDVEMVQNIDEKLNILNNLYFQNEKSNQKEILFYLKSKVEFITDKRKKKKIIAYILYLADSDFRNKEEIKALIYHSLNYLNDFDVLDLKTSDDKTIVVKIENNDVSKHETKLYFLNYIVNNFKTDIKKENLKNMKDLITKLTLQIYHIACGQLELKQLFNQKSIENKIKKMQRDLYSL